MNYLSSQNMYCVLTSLFCKNDYFDVHALCIPKEHTHTHTRGGSRIDGRGVLVR